MAISKKNQTETANEPANTVVPASSQEGAEASKPMPKGAKVFDILLTVFMYLLAAAILIGAVLFAFDASPDKSVFGYRYYTVLTGSMAPQYKVGDLIFVQIKGAKEIEVGDVITFNPAQDGETYLTHRVIEKHDNYKGTGVTCLRTKGDANTAEDSFLIDESRVIGTVSFGIPYLGYVVRFVQLRWYLVLPIVIMTAVFFYLLKRYFLMGAEEEEEDAGTNEVSNQDAPPVPSPVKDDFPQKNQ